MEFSFSPKRLVVAVAAALPLMASAADTPSTATARKGFAGYDHWICPYISRHLLSLNPLLACCRRYSRGER